MEVGKIKAVLSKLYHNTSLQNICLEPKIYRIRSYFTKKMLFKYGSAEKFNSRQSGGKYYLHISQSFYVFSMNLALGGDGSVINFERACLCKSSDYMIEIYNGKFDSSSQAVSITRIKKRLALPGPMKIVLF